MMNFMRKYKRHIIIVVIVTFVAGIGILGFNSFGGLSNSTRVIAEGKGISVSADEFYAFYIAEIDNAMRQSDKPLTQDQKQEIQRMILKQLVSDEVFYAQAKEYGIIVTDEELARAIQFSKMFSKNGVFDQRAYMYYVTNVLKTTPQKYEEIVRKQIAGDKFKRLLVSSIKVWNAEYAAALKANPKMTLQDLTNIKAKGVLDEWFTDLIRNSDIVINEKLLKDLL